MTIYIYENRIICWRNLYDFYIYFHGTCTPSVKSLFSSILSHYNYLFRMNSLILK